MPLLMLTVKFIVEFLQDDSAPYYEGVVLFGVFCLFAFNYTYLRHVSGFNILMFVLVLKKSTIGLLYRKLLNLSVKTIARTTSAKIINLASADISSLERTFEISTYIVISPLVFFVSIALVAYLVSFTHSSDRMAECDCPWVYYSLLRLDSPCSKPHGQDTLFSFKSN